MKRGGCTWSSGTMSGGGGSAHPARSAAGNPIPNPAGNPTGTAQPLRFTNMAHRAANATTVAAAQHAGRASSELPPSAGQSAHGHGPHRPAASRPAATAGEPLGTPEEYHPRGVPIPWSPLEPLGALRSLWYMSLGYFSTKLTSERN